MSRLSRNKGRPGRGRTGHKAAHRVPSVEVRTDRLGAQGDAIAEGPQGPLYIPFALPGERLRVRPGDRRGDGHTADLEEVLEPAPERVVPPCPHFGRCGSCATQHMAPAAEAAWKRTLVIAALGQRGFDAPPVEETVRISSGTRRRVVLGYRRTGSGTVLGFNARHSHTLIDIGPCPVLRPALVAVLPAVRHVLAAVAPGGATGDVMMVDSDDGLDMRLDLPAPPDLTAREKLAILAEDLDMARLTLRIDGREEPVAVRRSPSLPLGGQRVFLPSGAFLQPSHEGEAALLALVRAGLAGIDDGPILDLFSGLGTFALPLAETHTVRAYDSDPALIAALAHSRRVRAEVRDLFRMPLSGQELRGAAAVVFDPPRAGAQAQCRALAQDGPERLVAVSCNPATFARDARLLADGGYAIRRVTPVDQFAWSPHVELVAVLERSG